jgi:hypothetical protein
MTMTIGTGRRAAIQTLGLSIAASAIGLVMRTTSAQAALSSALTPQGAGQLNALMQRLAKAPRRRDFKSVPMILANPEQWDHEALSEILAYKPVPKLQRSLSCADPYNFNEVGGIRESRTTSDLSRGHAIEERRLKHA